MNNKTNYHSHCSFCDGKADMEQFLQAAVASGFSAYGISSHAPVPFPTTWTISPDQLENYLLEARRLQDIFQHQIEVYVGLEIDYLNEQHGPATPFFQQLPLDYRIGSVHLIYDETGEPIDLDAPSALFCREVQAHFDNDLPYVVRRFFANTRAMIAAGGFDFIAHVDKIYRNAEAHTPGSSQTHWYRKEWAETLDAIADARLLVEVNTKAYAEQALLFPHRSHFIELFRRSIPVVVNSDAHHPSRINAGRDEALGALWECGYRSVYELHNKTWQSVPISR